MGYHSQINGWFMEVYGPTFDVIFGAGARRFQPSERKWLPALQLAVGCRWGKLGEAETPSDRKWLAIAVSHLYK